MLKCDACGKRQGAPFDAGDECACGGLLEEPGHVAAFISKGDFSGDAFLQFIHGRVDNGEVALRELSGDLSLFAAMLATDCIRRFKKKAQ